jgi:hypothetical protein
VYGRQVCNRGNFKIDWFGFSKMPLSFGVRWALRAGVAAGAAVMLLPVIVRPPAEGQVESCVTNGQQTSENNLMSKWEIFYRGVRQEVAARITVDNVQVSFPYPIETFPTSQPMDQSMRQRVDIYQICADEQKCRSGLIEAHVDTRFYLKLDTRFNLKRSNTWFIDRQIAKQELTGIAKQTFDMADYCVRTVRLAGFIQPEPPASSTYRTPSFLNPATRN